MIENECERDFWRTDNVLFLNQSHRLMDIFSLFIQLHNYVYVNKQVLISHESISNLIQTSLYLIIFECCIYVALELSPKSQLTV